PDEPSAARCWDSHARESLRLKTALAPPLDQAFSALLEDLHQRGMLEETLVVCLAEFGRTPRMNRAGGRDHWGPVFSVALAGGGVRGGHVPRASDRQGGPPPRGRGGPPGPTAGTPPPPGDQPPPPGPDPPGPPPPPRRGEVIRAIL